MCTLNSCQMDWAIFKKNWVCHLHHVVFLTQWIVEHNIYSARIKHMISPNQYYCFLKFQRWGEQREIVYRFRELSSNKRQKCYLMQVDEIADVWMETPGMPASHWSIIIVILLEEIRTFWNNCPVKRRSRVRSWSSVLKNLSSDGFLS